MAALPGNVNFGKITGKFIRAIADGDDADAYPDGVPIVGLVVKVVADVSTNITRNATAAPPATILIDPIIATTDAAGFVCLAKDIVPGTGLCPPEKRGFFVVASDDEDLDPHGWTYRVTLSSPTFSPVSFSFAVPVDAVIDLSTVVPVPPNPGAGLVAWQAAVAETLQNAARAETAAGRAEDAVDDVPEAAAAAVGEQVTAQVTPLVGAAAGSATASASSATAAASSKNAAATSATNAQAAADTAAATVGTALAPVTAELAGRLSSTSLADTFGKRSFVDVEDFRNLTGTDASDDVPIQRAITYAGANAIPVVKLTRRAYFPRKQINLAGINNLTVEGLGMMETIITVTGTLADNSVALGSAFTLGGSGAGCSNITFRGFTVEGTVVDDTNGIPRRSRTKSGGGGVSQAFTFRGDLTPKADGTPDPTLPVIRDIYIVDVRVRHTNTLPWLLSGIRGDASVVGSISYNTMDPGWIYCERAIAHDLKTINGADNGFSLSRGNKSVIASNLFAQNCAAYGIWLGGFLVNTNSTDYGPTNFNVTNVTAINCGLGGIYLDEAPSNGRLSGILVNKMLRGTPSGDFGDSSSGTGIRIGGSPSNDLPNQVALASNLEISDFLLIDCAKGGIIVSGAQDVTVRNGTIVNAGSALDYSGAPVSDTSTGDNFGIAAKAGSTSKITRFTASAINVIDTRTTPLTNYPIYMTGAADTVWTDVRGVNTRRTTPTSSSIYREYQGANQFTSAIRAIVGIIAGSNSSTGTIAGTAVNGAALSRRVLAKSQTAGLDRWEIATTGDAESTGNAGSNLAVVSKTDAGATLHTLWTALRSLGVHVWGRSYVDSYVDTALAAAGAVVIDAASGNIQAITLSANATSSTITNASKGSRLTIKWVQDATGGYTYAWPTNCKFVGASEPTHSTAAFWRDAVTFRYDGTFWCEEARAIAVR